MTSALTPSRSPSAKLVSVGALGLLLGVPLALVGLLKWERMERADDVLHEVAWRAGQEQTLRGPQLAVPYTYSERTVRQGGTESRVDVTRRSGMLIISPARLQIDAHQSTQVLHRAIYELPVQTTELTFIAHFDGIVLPRLPSEAVVDWAAAHWLVGVADPRGLGQLEVSRAAGGAVEFGPADDRFRPYGPMAAPAAVSGPNHEVELRGRVVLSGVGAMRFMAAGVSTQVSMRSDWPHPSFDGTFVPTERKVDDAGFSAQWLVSSFARGLPEVSVDPSNIEGTWFGVRLMNPSDGYSQVGRSLKYGLLFIMLALGAFLVLELSSKMPVHPAQYGMVGLVQVSFYLLLLSLSEHTSVGASYALAGTATTVLTGVYALWTFGSARFAAAIFATTGVSYAFQYTLVQLEDHALLVGSIIVFLGLAVLMYATRDVQWYRLPPLDPAAQAELDRLETETVSRADRG